jgi:subtilisin family serine protease
MATPHVSGLVALMLQKDGTLDAPQVETILKTTAVPLTAGCKNVLPGPTEYCWGADATGAGLVTANAALSAVAATDTAAAPKGKK